VWRTAGTVFHSRGASSAATTGRRTSS
jgi:hypothetical protein